MGLTVNIYRSDYDSTLNVFYGKKSITVTNVEGPFQPTADRPAAKLSRNHMGNLIIVPDDNYDGGYQMNGGTFGSTSDSRFSQAIGIYGAIPIHDRRETPELYASLSD